MLTKPITSSSKPSSQGACIDTHRLICSVSHFSIFRGKLWFTESLRHARVDNARAMFVQAEGKFGSSHRSRITILWNAYLLRGCLNHALWHMSEFMQPLTDKFSLQNTSLASHTFYSVNSSKEHIYVISLSRSNSGHQIRIGVPMLSVFRDIPSATKPQEGSSDDRVKNSNLM